LNIAMSADYLVIDEKNTASNANGVRLVAVKLADNSTSFVTGNNAYVSGAGKFAVDGSTVAWIDPTGAPMAAGLDNSVDVPRTLTVNAPASITSGTAGMFELVASTGFSNCGLTIKNSLDATVRTIGNTVDAVLNDPGRRLNSAVDMSRLAPFSDAATSIDRTNLSNTFISYYTYGSAVALALDLSLRERSNGRISLDDYMRALWRKYGRPGGPQPGLVANPYTLRDARATLAEVAGDAAFADAFFDRYVEGRDVADYARLLQQAGLVLRKRNPDAAWLGPVTLDPSGRVSSLVQPGTPAIDAGFDQDDVITAVDGKRPAGASTLESIVRTHKPGDRVTIAFTHPDGTPGSGVVTLAEDPSVEAVTLESTGGVPTAAQQAFRAAWLGSKRAQP
jgi:predicted metalloprotease with PDZ domain